MEIEEIIMRITKLRLRANLSARALSLKINMNDSYINRLENSKTKFEPSLSTLMEIIKACNSTPEEFFYTDFDRYQSDIECLKFIPALSETRKNAIMNLYK